MSLCICFWLIIDCMALFKIIAFDADFLCGWFLLFVITKFDKYFYVDTLNIFRNSGFQMFFF